MKEKIIKVYEFKELSPKVQEKVLRRFRKNNEYSFLSEMLEDNLKQLLEKYDIKIISNLKIYYSLSYSQGDGFCFIGKFKFKNYHVNITHNYRYYHERSTDIYLSDEEGNSNFNDYEKLEQEFKELYYKICLECKKIGYAEIDYNDSEEVIKEEIRVNEYTFRENGEIENI